MLYFFLDALLTFRCGSNIKLHKFFFIRRKFVWNMKK